MGASPQEIINNQILDKCDFLVGVFWTRIGTATTEYASGTVEEIEKHIAADKPAMLYFSSQPVVMDTVDPDQYSELSKFKNLVNLVVYMKVMIATLISKKNFTVTFNLKLMNTLYFNLTLVIHFTSKRNSRIKHINSFTIKRSTYIT